MGHPTFLARTGLLVPTNISDYCMDPYKRVQFKAVLSQMNPNLNLLLFKATTKEMGVQVSPPVDKAIQCSIGPRTLHRLFSWSSWGQKIPQSARGIYSQAICHKGLLKLQKDGDDKEKALLGTEKTKQQPSISRVEEDKQEQLWHQDELEQEDIQGSLERKSKQAAGDATQHLRKSKVQVNFLSLFPFSSFLFLRQ